MTPLNLFSPLLERALRRAAAAHCQQVRKATDVPYITHPVQVAWILCRAGCVDEDWLAAALLHDVVEDCGVTVEELAREFSPAIAGIVDGLSERKRDASGRPRSWEERKREHLDELAAAPRSVRAIALADKLHNLSTIAVDLDAGADVWSRFNAPPARLLWYYEETVKCCAGVSAAGDELLTSLADACRNVLRRLAAAAPAAEGDERSEPRR